MMNNKIIAQILICFFIVSCVSKKDEKTEAKKDSTSIKTSVLIEDTLSVKSIDETDNLAKDTSNQTLKQRLIGRIHNKRLCELEELQDYYCSGWAFVNNEYSKKLSLAPVHRI